MPIRAYLYDADATDQEIPLPGTELPTLSDQQLLWVDIIGRDPSEIKHIATLFGFHRESLYTLLHPVGRPSLDHYPGYVQLNVTAVEPSTVGRSDPAPSDSSADHGWQPIALDFFAGANFVVTVHERELRFLSDFDRHIHDDSQLGALDSAGFLSSLLDWHLTSYFRVLEEFEDAIDDLDEEVLLHPNDRDFLEDMVVLRRRVSGLRRLLVPHREVFSALAHTDVQRIASSDSTAHFGTLYDRFERTMETTDHARELIGGSFDLYMTATARKTNDAVQVLTIVTVSLGIVGAVAGLMGVNFTLEFFKSGTVGFVSMLIGIISLIALVLFVARRRNWI